MLHDACKKGDLKLVKRLVSEGLDVQFKDEVGKTPLHVACEQSQVCIVTFLYNIVTPYLKKSSVG